MWNQVSSSRRCGPAGRAAVTAVLVASRRITARSYRIADVKSGQRVTGETVFEAASISNLYLQHVVEAITKEPFDGFMRHTVFTPLGMTHSSYVWMPPYDTMKA